jgi:hypothetical protein
MTRELLDAVTVKRPALIAQILAAEPRTTPAIVRRKPRRRPLMKLPQLPKPDGELDVEGVPWPAAPALVPFVIFAVMAGVIVVVLGVVLGIG